MANLLRCTIFPLIFLLPLAHTASANVTVAPSSTLAVPTGATLKLGCTDLNVQGGVTVGAAQVSQTSNVNIAAAGQLNGGQGTITLGGAWNNAGTFVAGTSTVIFSDDCGAAPFSLTGNTVFNNLTLVSSNGRNFVIPSGTHITVNGTLTLQGAAGLPIALTSSAGPKAFIALGSAANVTQSNATLSNVQIGAASAEVQNIPTLGSYGLMLLMLMLTLVAGKFSTFNVLSASSQPKRRSNATDGESRHAK